MLYTYIPELLLVLCLFYFGYLYHVYSYWRRRGVPGPVPIPILGNYGPVLFRIKTEKQLIQELYRRYSNEKCIGVFIGTKPALILKDLDMIKKVLITDFEFFPDRYIRPSAKSFNKSFFTMPSGERYKIMRSSILHLLAKENLLKAMPLLNQSIEHFIQTLPEMADHEICKLMKPCASGVIFQIVFGKEISTKKAYKFYKFSNTVAKLETNELFRTIEVVFPFLITVTNPFAKRICRWVLKHICDLINSVIDGRKNTKDNVEFKTILNYLITLKNKGELTTGTKNQPISLDFGLDDMYQQASNFLLASDSLSSLLCSVVYQLSKNLDYQEQCYEEIVKLYKENNGQMTWEAISNMKYLNMIIEESSRIHVISNVVERICCSKYTFPGTNISIDKGAHMLIPVHELHSDPKYFPEPDQCIPERFSAENKSKIPVYAFLPFSAGPRNCLGKSLAKFLALFTLSALLREIRFLPSTRSDGKLKLNPALRINLPLEMWVTFERR